jgi:hypothetical protein
MAKVMSGMDPPTLAKEKIVYPVEVAIEEPLTPHNTSSPPIIHIDLTNPKQTAAGKRKTVARSKAESTTTPTIINDLATESDGQDDACPLVMLDTTVNLRARTTPSPLHPNNDTDIDTDIEIVASPMSAASSRTLVEVEEVEESEKRDIVGQEGKSTGFGLDRLYVSFHASLLSRHIICLAMVILSISSLPPYPLPSCH